MAKNFVSTGSQLSFVAPAGGVVSGKPIKIGALTVVPLESALAGAEFTVPLAASGCCPATPPWQSGRPSNGTAPNWWRIPPKMPTTSANWSVAVPAAMPRR